MYKMKFRSISKINHSENKFDSLAIANDNILVSLLKKLGYFSIISIICFICFILIISFIIIGLRLGCNPSKVFWYADIKSEKTDEIIFINCIGFGVTGDHRIIKISKKKDSSFKKKEGEYFLEGFVNVWYKFQNDTLYICSDDVFSKPVKNDFKTPINFNCEKDLKLNDSKTMRINGYQQISPYQGQ